jgi:hypothetical protein
MAFGARGQVVDVRCRNLHADGVLGLPLGDQESSDFHFAVKRARKEPMPRLRLAIACALIALAAVPGAAVAAAAPVATTGGAKSVTASSAMLTGAVNPNGQSTTYYFQYGTTTGYGSQTSPASAGSGTMNVNVSSAISSLSPNATYHYRLVAQNASGTTFGADKSFKTTKPSLISLVALPSTLKFGQTTTLTGTVGGPGAARRTVTLERARAIGGPYTAFSIITADAKGKYSIAGVAPSANGFYKPVSNGSSSAPILVLVRFRIALFVSNTNPRRGHLVRFYGRVAPRHNGLQVRIQRLGSGGRWHLVKRVRLRSTFGNASKFNIPIAVNRGGLYRAVVGPDATHASGFSRSLRIRVH